MNILPTAATGAAVTASSAAETRLVGDYDSFLRLLTTQLRNQDPLSPLDATQFVSQLSQFAMVEQAIATNQRLETILESLRQSSLSADMGLIGKNVEVADRTIALRGGSAQASYSLPRDATQAAIVIHDQNGTVVRSIAVDSVAGNHSMQWDGRSNSGELLPDGAYSLTLVASDAVGKPVVGQTFVTAQVVRVELGASDVALVLDNGSRVSPTAVRAIVQS